MKIINSPSIILLLSACVTFSVTDAGKTPVAVRMYTSYFVPTPISFFLVPHHSIIHMFDTNIYGLHPLSSVFCISHRFE